MMKSLPKFVARLRVSYHAQMLDIVNVLNQIKVIKDDRAEVLAKKHCMEAFDGLRIIFGFDTVESMIDEVSKKRNYQ